MDLKQVFNDIFGYKPEDDYNFSILDDKSNTDTIDNSLAKKQEPKNIFTKLNDNLDEIKTLYNAMINSDIIIRNFTLNARGKQYNAFLLYIDGMIDSTAINDFVLEPLMLRNRNNIFDGNQNKILSESVQNNVTVRKVKKFDLTQYIYDCLIPQNNVSKVTEFGEIISGVNSGNCALFVDTINTCFDIDAKGFKQRGVEQPANEVIIQGPNEGFVENIRTNTSLIRRIVNNENLIIENIEVGEISKTKCAVCYLNNIANSELVAEVKYRINNLSIDSLLSTGQLEQLIEDTSQYGIPQMLSTERPDKCTKYLLQGRVVVLINGNPYALIMPATLIDFLTSPEDTNLKILFSNFLKGIRILSAFLTLLLPGIYIS